MKKLPFALIIFLASCVKNVDDRVNTDSQPTSHPTEKETCNFGMQHFSSAKRPTTSVLQRAKPSPSDATTTTNAVILLDFDGHTVSNTSWNTSGDFYCAPANMTSEEMTKIVQRVSEDFSPFNVAVTTDENRYAAADPYKRTRVVITETWEWYGQTGGTSFRGSFTWGDDTPCFVFNSLLGYNEKKVGEAASHEAGHTLGLRHQSAYDDGCTQTSEYNYGAGLGEIGWAPIMGCSYNQNITTWHNGPNPYGCTSLQNDVDIITSVIGVKADDYSNAVKSPFAITGTTQGLMNNSTDVDAFSVSLTSAKTITAKPYDVDGNVGPNVDLKLKVYDRTGNLLQTVSDAAALSASVVLSAGKYVITVETEENTYAKKYAMMGKYLLAVN